MSIELQSVNIYWRHIVETLHNSFFFFSTRRDFKNIQAQKRNYYDGKMLIMSWIKPRSSTTCHWLCVGLSFVYPQTLYCQSDSKEVEREPESSQFLFRLGVVYHICQNSFPSNYKVQMQKKDTTNSLLIW